MMPARRTFTLWAFCDESGDLDNPKDAHAVIAVAATARPEELRRIVRETKQAARRPSGHPLHAYSDPPQVTARLLERLAESRDARLLVTVLERQWAWRPVSYQEMVVYTLRSFLDTSSTPREHILIVVEERYKGARRLHFRVALADSLDLEPDQVRIERKNSPTWGAALQVADAVAWAHYQAMERGRGEFAALIASLTTVLPVGIDAQGVIRPVAELAGGPGGENKTAYL